MTSVYPIIATITLWERPPGRDPRRGTALAFVVRPDLMFNFAGIRSRYEVTGSSSMLTMPAFHAVDHALRAEAGGMKTVVADHHASGSGAPDASDYLPAAPSGSAVERAAAPFDGTDRCQGISTPPCSRTKPDSFPSSS